MFLPNPWSLMAFASTRMESFQRAQNFLKLFISNKIFFEMTALYFSFKEYAIYTLIFLVLAMQVFVKL